MVFIKQPFIRDSIIFIVLFVLAGLLQVFYPVEVVWDLVNYHYYNPWAFFHHRLGYDIAPAMVNTYFNPLIDIPYYLMINAWNNHLNFALFFQGSYYGILLFIVYKICGLFFDLKKEPLALGATLIIAATGYAAFSQAGSCSNEIQVSILILWAFYLICKHIGDENRKKDVWIWSGMLMGAALGFKPTVISYCMGMGITLILFAKHLRISFREIMIFALSGLGGYLLINGWWMWQLYVHFDNPFFPFLNKIFKSEYFDLINFRDTMYIDKTNWMGKIFLPLIISFSYPKKFVSEVGFIDFRYAVVFLILLFLFCKWLVAQRKLTEKSFILLYAFIVISYVIWLNLFSIIRYAVPIEMLCAIIIVKFFQKINVKNFLMQIVVLSFKIIGVYILLSECFYYRGIWPFRSMALEKLNLPENALVEVYGNPLGMHAAQLVGDQSNRIIAYANGEIGDNIEFLENKKLREIRGKIVDEHQGPVVALVTYGIVSGEDLYKFFYIARSRVMQLEKEGMYCRPLQSYLIVADICVPKDLKDQIFVEEEKRREFGYTSSDTLDDESKKNADYIEKELSHWLNYDRNTSN